jgi:hypothetical protein
MRFAASRRMNNAGVVPPDKARTAARVRQLFVEICRYSLSALSQA